MRPEMLLNGNDDENCNKVCAKAKRVRAIKSPVYIYIHQAFSFLLHVLLFATKKKICG